MWDDLSYAGLNLQESNKQELENIVLVNTLLRSGRLKITKNCQNLITEMRNYKWKKMKLGQQRNQPEETVDKDNHFIDALLYLTASLEELKSVDYEAIKMSKKTIAYLNTQRKDSKHAMFKNS